MIDPEIRDIIAAELAEGEELLWAEKADPEKKENWKTGKRRDDRTALFFLVLASLVVIFVMINADSVRGKIICTIFLFAGMFAIVETFKNTRNPENYLAHKDFGGYVLTSVRLIYLNNQLRVSSSVENLQIKRTDIFYSILGWRWSPASLNLRPPKKTWVSWGEELYFLKDFKRSKEHIDSKIQRMAR